MELEEAINWVEDLRFANIDRIEKEAIETVLQELDRFQKENDLAKKALIANSYEADERNNLLTEVQRLKKENEELKIERDSYRTQVNSAFDKGFIHKDKIREKIEEIKEEDLELRETDSEGDIVTKCEQRAVLNILQDLLKEE